jgi:hypothetical protein
MWAAVLNYTWLRTAVRSEAAAERYKPCVATHARVTTARRWGVDYIIRNRLLHLRRSPRVPSSLLLLLRLGQACKATGCGLAADACEGAGEAREADKGVELWWGGGCVVKRWYGEWWWLV